MSIFDGDDINPVPYLSEKTLSALQYAAALIDLANEPDTTTWYKRNLMEIAEGIVVHLVPAVAVLNWSGQESAEQSRAILNGGTFALARWCKKHNIGNPTQIGKKLKLEVLLGIIGIVIPIVIFVTEQNRKNKKVKSQKTQIYV